MWEGSGGQGGAVRRWGWGGAQADGGGDGGGFDDCGGGGGTLPPMVFKLLLQPSPRVARV